MKLDFLLPMVSKIRLGSVFLVAFSLIVSQAVASTTNPVSGPAFEVTVQVRLYEATSGEVLKDYSEVVAWLVPVRTFHTASLNTDRPHYRMMEHDKMFEPHLLVVPAGSIVKFQNRDAWFHDAFSISGNQRLDLGPNRAGGQKTVRFNRAGVAYVFCNLHPQMAAVILTVESPYFGVSDKAGHISIGNVPPGTYVLHVWYENASSQTLKTLHRPIVLRDNHSCMSTVSIKLGRRTPDC